jgi:acyl dehydratase
MPALVQVASVDDLRALATSGRRIGPSPWREITQAMVDAFAELGGDRQWIHTDPARAKRESAYGGTIAHGNLTLAMLDGFRPDLLERVGGFSVALNYGWNKVRFPAPLPVGSRVRATLEVASVEELEGGWVQVVYKWTVEREGGDKPVCVAENVGRLRKA